MSILTWFDGLVLYEAFSLIVICLFAIFALVLILSKYSYLKESPSEYHQEENKPRKLRDFLEESFKEDRTYYDYVEYGIRAKRELAYLLAGFSLAALSIVASGDHTNRIVFFSFALALSSLSSILVHEERARLYSVATAFFNELSILFLLAGFVSEQTVGIVFLILICMICTIMGERWFQTWKKVWVEVDK